MSDPIIRVENLKKNYGLVQALRGVSFQIREGEVFGLLGPNGAGKTTTVEILEGMRAADSGNVQVCDTNPQAAGAEFQRQIGAVLQHTSLPDKLRVAEALELFARLHRTSPDIAAWLRRFALDAKRDAFYAQLSGGQKQRLALALALVHQPRVLFLDEPTAGLDPQSRREIYALVQELRGERKTILLTTHYIEEAERLCDRVAIIDHGRLIAQGSPRELKTASGDGQATTRIEVRLARPEPEDALRRLEGVTDCRLLDGTYVLHCSAPPQTIVALVKHLEAGGNQLQSLETASRSLEDVFLELTGRRLRD